MVNKQPGCFAGLHKWKGFVGILVCCILGCGTSHKVYRVDKEHVDKNHGERGVYYTLPRTVITVELPIIQTTYTPGPYAELSAEILGQEAKTGDSVTYKLGTPVLGTRAEPDPNETFLVKIAGTPLETRTLMLQLSEDGRITSAQSTVENKTVDFVVSTVKTSANIAAKAIMSGSVPSDEVSKGKDAEGEHKRTMDPIACKLILIKLNPDRSIIVPKKVLDKIMSDLTQTLGNTTTKELETNLNKKSFVFKDNKANEEKVFVLLSNYGQLKSFINDAIDMNEKLEKTLKDALKDYKDIVLVYEDCKLEDSASFDFVKAVGTETAKTIADKIKDNKETIDDANLGEVKKKVICIKSNAVSYMYKELKRPIADGIASEMSLAQKARNKLTEGSNSGIVEITEAVMNLMLKEIDKLQTARLENFFGTLVEAVWKARFEWIPDGSCTEEKINKNIELLEFTIMDGIRLCKGAKPLNNVPKDFVTKEFSPSLKPQRIVFNFSLNFLLNHF